MWPFKEPKIWCNIHEYDQTFLTLKYATHIESKIVPYKGEYIVYQESNEWQQALVSQVIHMTNSRSHDIESVTIIVVDVRPFHGIQKLGTNE